MHIKFCICIQTGFVSLKKLGQIVHLSELSTLLWFLCFVIKVVSSGNAMILFSGIISCMSLMKAMRRIGPRINLWMTLLYITVTTIKFRIAVCLLLYFYWCLLFNLHIITVRQLHTTELHMFLKYEQYYNLLPYLNT